MFEYLIAVEPLGLLYGYAGRTLSSKSSLMGLWGLHFPPDATTLSGLFAAEYGNDAVQDLQVAGPFWADTEVLQKTQDFYVPMPINYLAAAGTIQRTLVWQSVPEESEEIGHWHDISNLPLDHKYTSSGWWIKLSEWDTPHQVKSAPWRFIPHLHPRMETNERHVARLSTDTRSSLFLENAVQLYPNICLVYLSNQFLPTGWYRFGGEGHMVNITSYSLPNSIRTFLNRSPGCAFALITPAVWGSNRLSYRYPQAWKNQLVALLTDRPVAFRYRMGGASNTKHLSRGRYAVPAGSVYVLEIPLEIPWHHWPENWFPKEGPSLKRWGCGLALPLKEAII
ncbi:MAG: CRISPR-associated protein Cmr3 [Symploca sp. SIO2E6]|nr:CRISPR-associated protein Cmr3 [Symploca sp. SIO2E6]